MQCDYRRLNKPKPGFALPVVECFPAIGSAVPAHCCHFPADLAGSVGEPPQLGAFMAPQPCAGPWFALHHPPAGQRALAGLRGSPISEQYMYQQECLIVPV